MKFSNLTWAARAATLGKSAWATTLIALLSITLVAGGCKKATSRGETAKLLPAAVAKDLAVDALAIVDGLTDKTQLFGFLDLGQPLPALATAWGADKAMVDELLALLEARAGLNLRQLRVAGMAKFTAQDPVFFFPGIAGKATKPDVGFSQQYNGVELLVIDKFFATKLGTMLAVGTEQAIKGYLDERAAKGPSLAKANAPWVKHALTLAAAHSFMVTVNGATLQNDNTDAELRAVAPHVATATMLISASGLRYEFQANPGQATALHGKLAAFLDLGRAEVQRLATAAANDEAPGASLHALAIRTYGMHLFDSIEHNVAGDVVSFRLPWHAPPDFTMAAAPALAQRVSAPGEWAVAQANFGGPLLPTLLRYTDVIGKPLDLTAIEAEIKTLLLAKLGVDVTQTHAVAFSMGNDAPFASLVNTASSGGQATAGAVRQLEDASLMAMPWGTALTSAAQADALRSAAATPAAKSALTSHELLSDNAAGTTIMRLAFDLAAAPAAFRAQLGDQVPVTAGYARLSTTGLELQVQAAPGKAPAIVGMIGLGLGFMQDQARKLYEQRNTAPLPEAMAGVIAHYQAQAWAATLKPKDLGNDRLSLTVAMPATTSAFRAQAGVAVVGILAAVAIPAFMTYMAKAKASDLSMEARDDQYESAKRAVEEATATPQIAAP